jgi:hypothetical protein
MCSDITSVSDLNQYYDTSDNRQFENIQTRGQQVKNDMSVYACGNMCNNDEQCVAFGYYNDRLKMPESYWGKGTCQTFYDKPSQQGQPIWPNLLIAKKLRVL